VTAGFGVIKNGDLTLEIPKDEKTQPTMKTFAQLTFLRSPARPRPRSPAVIVTKARSVAGGLVPIRPTTEASSVDVLLCLGLPVDFDSGKLFNELTAKGLGWSRETGLYLTGQDSLQYFQRSECG
jgi:hypothetical protein